MPKQIILPKATAVTYLCSPLPADNPDAQTHITRQRELVAQRAADEKAQIIAEYIDYNLASCDLEKTLNAQYLRMLDYLKQHDVDFLIQARIGKTPHGECFEVERLSLKA